MPKDNDSLPDVDPEDFLRALLAVSPEDAKGVRDIATVKAELPDDDDPDVVAGMKRLRELRRAESEIPDA